MLKGRVKGRVKVRHFIFTLYLLPYPAEAYPHSRRDAYPFPPQRLFDVLVGLTRCGVVWWLLLGSCG